MTKWRHSGKSFSRLKAIEAARGSASEGRAPDGTFAALLPPAAAVVVVETRQQRRYQERMAAKGKTAIAGADVANVVEGLSYTDLAGSQVLLEDGKTISAGGAE